MIKDLFLFFINSKCISAGSNLRSYFQGNLVIRFSVQYQLDIPLKHGELEQFTVRKQPLKIGHVTRNHYYNKLSQYLFHGQLKCYWNLNFPSTAYVEVHQEHTLIKVKDDCYFPQIVSQQTLISAQRQMETTFSKDCFEHSIRNWINSFLSF